MISDLEKRIYAAALLLKEKSFRITINKNIQYMLYLENILDDSNMNKISLDIKEMIDIFALLKEIRINIAQIRGEDYQ